MNGKFFFFPLIHYYDLEIKEKENIFDFESMSNKSMEGVVYFVFDQHKYYPCLLLFRHCICIVIPSYMDSTDEGTTIYVNVPTIHKIDDYILTLFPHFLVVQLFCLDF